MEIKDIFEYLGVSTEIDSVDKFKSAFNGKFLPLEQAHTNEEVVSKVIGKKFGSQKTVAKRIAKEFDIDLDEEILKQEPEKIFEHISKSAKTKIEELDTLVKTNGDDAIKEWQEKYQKVEAKAKDYETSTKSLREELDKVKKDKDESIRSFKINAVKKDILSGLKFSKSANDFARKGFEATIAEKYVIDFDDKDEPYVADVKTGQRMPNPNKAGDFLGIKDVFAMEAESGGLLEKNNAAEFTPKTFKVAEANNGNNNGVQGGSLRAIPASQR